MNRTNIEYLDYSWNPIAMRCTPVSEGCANCWHLRMANRLAGNQNLPFDMRRAYAGEGPPVFVPERIMKPINRKKPARIGAQWMGDLFHKNISDLLITQIWGIMWACPQHTWLVLTKHPERMRRLLIDNAFKCSAQSWASFYSKSKLTFEQLAWPVSNIWLGVTVETADYLWRIEELVKIPAAMRFVSLEPLLGEIHLNRRGWLFRKHHFGKYPEECDHRGFMGQCINKDHWDDGGISWIIVGGESGPNARPMHPQWARDIRDQCQAANVPFFMKQWGTWKPIDETDKKLQEWVDKPDRFCWLHHKYGQPSMGGPYANLGWQMLEHVGKEKAGRLLDGREWNEFPSHKSS